MGSLRSAISKGKAHKIWDRNKRLIRSRREADLNLGDDPKVSRLRSLEKMWLETLGDPPVSHSDPNQWRRAADVRPSSFPFCPRRYVMDHMGLRMPSDFDVKSCFYTEVGKAIHYVAQNALARNGRLWGLWICARPNCANRIEGVTISDKPSTIPPSDYRCEECGSSRFEYEELTVEDEEIGLRGHVDGVFLYDTYSTVFEAKSSSDDKVREMRSMASEHISNLFVSESPWYGYWHQAGTYATLLRKMYPDLPPIKYIDFMIYGRGEPNNVLALRMEVPEDNHWYYEIKSRVLTAQYALRRKVLPAGFAKKPSDLEVFASCTWCLHKDVCLSASKKVDTRYDALYSKRASKVLSKYKKEKKEILMGQVITGDVVDTSKVMVPEDEEDKKTPSTSPNEEKADDETSKESTDS